MSRISVELMIKDLVRYFDEVEAQVKDETINNITILEEKFQELIQSLESIGSPDSLSEVEMMQLGRLMERLQHLQKVLDDKSSELKEQKKVVNG